MDACSVYLVLMSNFGILTESTCFQVKEKNLAVGGVIEIKIIKWYIAVMEGGKDTK